MSVWIDRKFIESLSFRLERFKKRGNIYNFKCCLCGDSAKNKAKTRSYFYQIGEGYNHFCHNCGASSSFANFLKRFDSGVYAEYLYESLKDRGASMETLERVAPKPPLEENPFQDLERLKDLPSNHYARRYVIERMIPEKYLEKFYFTPTFRAFVNSKIPGKFASTTRDEPRVIIPIVSKLGVIGFQGRSLDRNNPIRYITISLEPDIPLIFGMDTVDLNRKYYVFEGPIDSVFVPNSIAVCGSSITQSLVKIGNKDKAVIVFDCEPRNEHIVTKMQQAIDQGFRVTIWPKDMKFKDANDMIMNGYTSSDINHIIDRGSLHGLEASIALMDWKKV